MGRVTKSHINIVLHCPSRDHGFGRSIIVNVAHCKMVPHPLLNSSKEGRSDPEKPSQQGFSCLVQQFESRLRLNPKIVYYVCKMAPYLENNGI